MSKPHCSLQDLRRISAESMVDMRTIQRALRGEAVRQTSKERIMRAARKLGLKLGVLAILATGCGLDGSGLDLFGSTSTNEGGHDAGAAGSGGSSGSESGAAGMAGSGVAGAFGDEAGSDAETQDAVGEPISCIGSGSGWKGCNDNGCGVCVEIVAAYLHYFSRHPGCWPNNGTSCATGNYLACSDGCPAPTPADQ